LPGTAGRGLGCKGPRGRRRVRSPGCRDSTPGPRLLCAKLAVGSPPRR
jgi:hypothetical protein